MMLGILSQTFNYTSLRLHFHEIGLFEYKVCFHAQYFRKIALLTNHTYLIYQRHNMDIS